MKLLLHTCCGPCFLGVWEELGTHDDIETILYYFNPNVQPDEEYAKRLENLKKAAASKSTDLLVGEYEPTQHKAAIAVENGEFPRRCLQCYRLRLTETARKAKAEGYDAFSTTLLVSPYQQHDALKKIGEEVAEELGIDFYYTDWRPFFREGQSEAKEMELYRQKYCGCLYSKVEANN